MISLDCRAFGGGNWADEALSLLARSHRFNDGGWGQYAPMEASDQRNIDFSQRALAKRKGSALIDASASVHASSEVIRGGFSAGGVQFLVGKKSMYRKASGGSWTIMRNSGDSAAFAWDADVTKWSVTIGDGYAFVGTDATAQEVAVVNPASNVMMPELKNGNLYTDQKSGGTNACTGTWPTACYIVVWFQNRLMMSDGDNVFDYTPPADALTSGIWDLTNGGYWLAKDNIVAGATFVPRGENDLLERLFVWSKWGLQIVPGFDLTDSPLEFQGVGVPVCHRAVASSQNWVIYPTEQQTVEAANFYSVEDLGRRGLNGDGSTGPLDNFDSSNTNHTTVSFSFYDRKKKQWLFFYPDGASRTTTSMAFGLDFQIGEPGAGERQADYETHTRPLWHSIKTPATNAWFVGMYQHGDIIVGVTADGQTWTVNSGLNDLASVAIEDHWDTPEFDGGDPTRTKCFRLLLPLTEDRGNWNLDIQYALDGSTEFSDAYSFIQASTGSSFIGTGTVGTATIGEGGRATGASYLELNGRTLRLRFKNQRLSEDWLMAAFSHQYQMGSMQL